MNTLPVLEGKKIAVWFSCGVASAVATKITLDTYAKNNEVIVLNNPVIEEDEDNLRFLKEVEEWLGVKIHSVVNPNYPNCSANEIWVNRKYMAGINGAPCTMLLKKQARQIWEQNNIVDYHVLGFTHDELHRYKKFILTERENTLPILIANKLSKEDCFKILDSVGIKKPRIYNLGYPNANCIGCVKSSSPTYWDIVRSNHPDIFNRRAEVSRLIKCKLVRYKGKRIFLDELPSEIKRVKLRKLNFECGIFCEEKVNE